MENRKKVVVAQMRPHQRREWKKTTAHSKRIKWDKRLLRRSIPLAAVFFCLGAAAITSQIFGKNIQSVFNHVTTQFSYDDTLGRLQFVSHILPESAMVFLTSDESEVQTCAAVCTQKTQTIHAWSEQEPWIEYETAEKINSCLSGEVMNIVKNRQDEYTVRILHPDGYESVYSGLTQLEISEGEKVEAGQKIGTTASGFAAFELRKDGLSIMPVFGG